VSNMRRSDRGKRRPVKQRGGARQQERLGGQAAQGAEETTQATRREGRKGGRADLVILDEHRSFILIKKAKPPTGCHWQVHRDATQVVVRVVDDDGETQVELTGEYCNNKTGLWRDPCAVAETLAMAVLFSAAVNSLGTVQPPAAALTPPALV
jgi:hypothetical protein